jgi:hypothetical protein
MVREKPAAASTLDLTSDIELGADPLLLPVMVFKLIM